MDFEEKLNMYAKLLICHGLNVQKGQIVHIGAEVCHRDFCYRAAEAAYERGAKYVHIDLTEPRLQRLRLQRSKEEDLHYVPSYIPAKYDELVEQTGANLRILGSEDPDILDDMEPARVNTMQLHYRQALRSFYEEGIGKSKVQWTIGAASTPKWGQKVYPELDPEAACAKLWEDIFAICRADHPDCLALWKEHNETLRKRAQRLTDLKIRHLHFQGPGTDLTVGLSPKAVFKGGTDRSPRGADFEPNIPTEECFTTPDCRVTQGHVRATRPFLINGKLIKDLCLEFHEGEIVKFTASQGEETFREYIHSDPGGKYLGEVALVGVDSPIFQTGRVYEEILFDENAACHIAVGFAYKFCLENGPHLSKEELAAIGCNDSSIHTDMMISSEEVDVTALTYKDTKIPLIEKGQWVEF